MYIEVTTNLAMKTLRKDIVEHLEEDGVAAILAHYNREELSTGEPVMFDESLFNTWTRYADLEDALNKIDKCILEDIFAKHPDTEDGVDWVGIHEDILAHFKKLGKTVIFVNCDVDDADDYDIFDNVIISD